MTADLGRRALVLAAVPLTALVCGYAVVSHTVLAALLAAAVVGGIALALGGPRTFPFAIVLVAVAPWYPYLSPNAVAPLLPQRDLCAIILAAPLVPWLWSVGSGVPLRRPSPLVGLYGLLFAGLAVAVYDAVSTPKDLVSSQIVGLLSGGLVFVGSRRFADARRWGPAAAVGVTALIGMGLAAAALAPGERVGAFTGYAITFGALVVGLLPPALAWALGRSRLLAALLAAGAAAVLILSESRSSWIAAVVLLLVLAALLLRQRRWRALAAMVGLVLVAGGAIAASGSLGGIVERKLGPGVSQTDSVTHRAWSYGYAVGQIRERPIFGAGAPGYAAKQAEQETNIGALDNGYLSILVDAGAFGLLAVGVPIVVALLALGRWLRRRESPPPEVLGLALGVLAIAVVTAFYDSFYWAQLCLLLFAMAGALSAQPRAVRATATAVAPTPAPRAPRRVAVSYP